MIVLQITELLQIPTFTSLLCKNISAMDLHITSLLAGLCVLTTCTTICNKVTMQEDTLVSVSSDVILTIIGFISIYVQNTHLSFRQNSALY